MDILNIFQNFTFYRDKDEQKMGEKKFVARNSILTDLFETQHGKIVYNILSFMIIFCLLDVIIDEVSNTGR